MIRAFNLLAGLPGDLELAARRINRKKRKGL